MSKPKKALFDIIKPSDVVLSGQPYELMLEIRAEDHFEIATARVALAWKKGTKVDCDGHLTLGYCQRVTDLEREFMDFDFVIVLNKEIWEDPEFTRAQKLALLDHELCHAARAKDSEGNPMTDSKGRPVWRMRKHDIEEFSEIIRRHGCYKRDLQNFAEEIMRKRESPLLHVA